MAPSVTLGHRAHPLFVVPFWFPNSHVHISASEVTPARPGGCGLARALRSPVTNGLGAPGDALGSGSCPNSPMINTFLAAATAACTYHTMEGSFSPVFPHLAMSLPG